ncbi:hypothetical protein [Sulfolobus acidocaldarius]|uniref:Uncharacterized protein n=1 Tax=Sulfolobus acidocaldarius TaxID=2285 RepID=A0A0U2XZM0_9CREN|nr:hypothetical protein [Sulfolobus acidocaldarius]ALU28753.1 hypothetical protein ATY89_01450 [Sulfolobus acidocaldarius]ALU31473.1 hypothetical protein ATZ20_04485 [Sulfolobus acidocaldarius]
MIVKWVLTPDIFIVVVNLSLLTLTASSVMITIISQVTQRLQIGTGIQLICNIIHHSIAGETNN